MDKISSERIMNIDMQYFGLKYISPSGIRDKTAYQTELEGIVN